MSIFDRAHQSGMEIITRRWAGVQVGRGKTGWRMDDPGDDGAFCSSADGVALPVRVRSPHLGASNTRARTHVHAKYLSSRQCDRGDATEMSACGPDAVVAVTMSTTSSFGYYDRATRNTGTECVNSVSSKRRNRPPTEPEVISDPKLRTNNNCIYYAHYHEYPWFYLENSRKIMGTRTFDST